MPNRSRNGDVSIPARVVAPTSVKGGRSSLIDSRPPVPRRWTMSELIVLHRGIEDLLDRGIQPVHLVDEEHVARFQVGEQRREIARALQHRTRGLAQSRLHLVGHDVGQGGLAQARRAEDEEVVQGLAPPARRLDEDLHLFQHGRLTDEVREPLGANGPIEGPDPRPSFLRSRDVLTPSVPAGAAAPRGAFGFNTPIVEAGAGAGFPDRLNHGRFRPRRSRSRRCLDRTASECRATRSGPARFVPFPVRRCRPPFLTNSRNPSVPNFGNAKHGQ